MSSEITYDALMAEWNRLGLNQVRNDAGKSALEWAEEWGVSKDASLKTLKKFQKAGWLKAGSKIISNLAGGSSRVPCYQIVMPEKKARGKK